MEHPIMCTNKELHNSIPMNEKKGGYNLQNPMTRYTAVIHQKSTFFSFLYFRKKAESLHTHKHIYTKSTRKNPKNRDDNSKRNCFYILIITTEKLNKIKHVNPTSILFGKEREREREKGERDIFWFDGKIFYHYRNLSP